MSAPATPAGPRISLAAYRPKPGRSRELRLLLERHVPTLRLEGLASGRPSIAMEAEDGTLLEIFEWVSSEAIQAAHQNPAVLALWAEFSRLGDPVALAELDESRRPFAGFRPLGPHDQSPGESSC